MKVNTKLWLIPSNDPSSTLEINHKEKRIDIFMGFLNDYDKLKYIPNHEKSFKEFQHYFLTIDNNESLKFTELAINDWIILDNRNHGLGESYDDINAIHAIQLLTPMLLESAISLKCPKIISTDKDLSAEFDYPKLSGKSINKIVERYNVNDNWENGTINLEEYNCPKCHGSGEYVIDRGNHSSLYRTTKCYCEKDKMVLTLNDNGKIEFEL